MKVLVVLALVGCGRSGFDGHDAAIDAAAIDAPAIDADTRLPGLIAWYRLDDVPSDGLLDDSSGNGRTARCVAGISCPSQVAGVHGNAVHFDGVDQYLRVIYDPGLATPTAFSIAGWIYLDTQVDQVAFAKPYGSSALDSWAITAWSPASGKGTCLETIDATTNPQDVCGPTLPTGRWIHVGGVWTGSSKTLFIDGVQVGQVTSAPVALIDTHDVIVGGDENTGSPAYLFHGSVDELQIYDRALTSAELAMLATP